ncbi:FUSC family protein, partial [Streptomyces sp. TRM76130]|nr:FUSC family protein [Streptomyces sp. TRM76130]
LLLTARSARRADTLTLHLPGAPAPSVRRMPGADEAAALLRRDLGALRELVVRPPAEARGTALSHLRNRLLGYRDEENLPAASPAVQDVFRGIGETARAVMGLRVALDGPQDESDDSPATTRSREELDAEDAAIDAGEEAADGTEPTGLRRPTTRAAVQVSVGSTLAIVGGEMLSSERWYWAV